MPETWLDIVLVYEGLLELFFQLFPSFRPALSLYIGTPFRLALPSGVLTFRRSNATTTPTPTTTTPPSSGYGAYEANMRFDDHQPGSSYTSYGEGDYYSRNDQDGGSGYFGGYGRRSIDSERRAGFAIIQNGLDKWVPLSIVCYLHV